MPPCVRSVCVHAAEGGWAQWLLLDGVTQINDLLVDADDRLWVAAQHTDGARIYRMEIGEATTGFESGPDVPDFLGKVVAVV